MRSSDKVDFNYLELKEKAGNCRPFHGNKRD